MDLWIGAVNLGLVYAFMAMGAYITYRIHDFPDITIDGSFVTGAAVSAVLIVAGKNPFFALLLSFFAGAFAGTVTAFIHTRFKINGLLAGILVMTGLYSVNLHIMGRSNIPLLNQPGVTTTIKGLNPGLPHEVWLCIAFIIVIIFFWAVTSLFFRTNFGVSMRATGNNPSMAGASGINVNMVKTVGIALANGLAALSGSFVAQYQGFADIGMGIGSIVFALAAVIIGESVLRAKSLYGKVLGVIVGSVVFRLMIAFALYVGLNPTDLKLVTALFVLLVLVMPRLVPPGRITGLINRGRNLTGRIPHRVFISCAAACLILAAAGFFLSKHFFPASATGGRRVTIGIVQSGDNPPMDITRDSLIGELKRLGYEDGKNAVIYRENAHGDLATISSILDKFLRLDVDVVVPISTACAQAAANKIKGKPVVFATVANPFILGIGKSDTDHPPNITGVYGAVPADKFLDFALRVLPGKTRFGTIWDPSQANSTYNIEKLKEEVAKRRGIRFKGATVANSSEVYEAAQALAGSGIDFFLLPTDHVVFSAFESVVKAAAPRKIPIFLSDVERLHDGAVAAYGFDYTSSGIQTAHLVDRVIKGENPSKIPFEQYRKTTLGISLVTAKQLGITIPQNLLAEATIVQRESGGGTSKNANPKRMALFVFSDSYIMQLFTMGVMSEFKKRDTLSKYNLTVDLKNSQNDYGTAQAIVQDIVRQHYDYIVTGSSLALQVAANGNKSIPHVFGAVTDPYRMGIARNAGDHPPHITGIATFQPVESAIQAMRRIFPRTKRIGILWNPGEANSEACTLKARDSAKKYGFDLVEMNVTSTDEVKDALAALINKGIDIFFTSGDNTVILALATVAAILKERKIPYFTNDPSDINHETFYSVGADYVEVGAQAAIMAERVLAGEQVRNIPIRNYVPEKIALNLGLAKAYGVTIPADIVKKAATVKR